MMGLRTMVVRGANAIGRLRVAGPIVAGVIVLAGMGIVPTASAQAPTSPMPNDACTAKLTLDPSTISAGGERGVGVLLSGFEPGALFSVFVGSHYFGGGRISSDGTGAAGIFVDAVTAAAPKVQATTGNRCAVATLTIVGPLRVNCEPVIVNDIIIACPFIVD